MIRKALKIFISLTALSIVILISGKMLNTKACYQEKIQRTAAEETPDISNGEVPEDTESIDEERADSERADAGTVDIETEEIPAEYTIEGFPVTLQMPELPTGCEVTALTMVLNYYGFSVDKTTMASEFLPVSEANLYYGDDGRLYGVDLNQFFAGNPFTESGIICGTQAIVTAADAYLQSQGSPLLAKDITGSSYEELYERVSKDQPVVVWVTIEMADRWDTQDWYTETGSYVDWSMNDHGAVLIGYTDTTVTIADPISGEIQYGREQFESVFASRGSQCVVIE